MVRAPRSARYNKKRRQSSASHGDRVDRARRRDARRLARDDVTRVIVRVATVEDDVSRDDARDDARAPFVTFSSRIFLCVRE